MEYEPWCSTACSGHLLLLAIYCFTHSTNLQEENRTKIVKPMTKPIKYVNNNFEAHFIKQSDIPYNTF
jgi:hypothetical protein